MAATLGTGSLESICEGLRSGDLSSEALTQVCLDTIQNQDPFLNAITSTNPGSSLGLARAADIRLKKGERGVMLGIPVVLKDNFHWTGLPVSNGSKITRSYIAHYDATVVKRLLEAGAIPIAKANMDEFAMGSSGEYSAFGPTRNPWDLSRVPGGSSSGSIVSVAAGYAPFALGSDTGGSVRLPAGFCNVTALRPTYGVLSRYGITAMASSLDQVGPVARTASGVAAGFSVMTGRDALDSTSIDLPGTERLVGLKPASLKGLRIGLPKEYFGEGLDPAVRSIVENAVGVFEREGASIIDISLPHTSYAIDTYYLICTSEVSSNMSRFDGVRYGARKPADSLADMMAETREQGFGEEVKRRILLGAFCLSKGYYDAFYLKALKARTLITKDFLEAFEKVDLIATPVSPDVAFPIGEKTLNPLAMYLADAYTVTTPLAALPCLSMPGGFTNGLPVGVQLIGPALSDVNLLEAAHAFQQLTDYHLQTPPNLN